MQSFSAAVVQMKSGPNKDANLDEATARVEEAARGGAELVALPEVFVWRGPRDREREQAEPIPGPTSDAMSALARRLKIHLVAGSLLESCPGQELPFNTTTLFGPSGDLLARYRKIHLFDVDLPGRVTVCESDLRASGDEVVCVETLLGRIGLAVCYDLRFPELFRRLAQAGAEIVVIPASFTRPTGQAHWEPLLRARAIENQCFVLAPNQYGASAQGFYDYGHSMILDPWGAVLACGPAEEAAIVRAQLDGELLARVRRELPALTHRRLP